MGIPMEADARRITPTRLQPKGWARVGPAGAHTLRRGAWYPVVRISSSNIVVLDVNRHNVPVDRRLIEIRYQAPERWTIVRCEPRLIERIGRIFPLTYAVCPSCRHRQAFGADAKRLACDRCHNAAPLAWDELS
jgi:hypothetical protein